MVQVLTRILKMTTQILQSGTVVDTLRGIKPKALNQHIITATENKSEISCPRQRNFPPGPMLLPIIISLITVSSPLGKQE